MRPIQAPARLLFVLACVVSSTAVRAGTPDLSRVRRPVALAVSADGRQVYVSNARSGSLSVIDPAAGKVLLEADLGRGLSDLARLPDGRLLALDGEGGSLLLVDPKTDPPRGVARRDLGGDPVRVALLGGGTRAAVASTAARRLTVVAVPSLEVRATLDLPVRPRELAVVTTPKGERVVVADAFLGTLALVDPAGAKVERLLTFPGHNVRGLAASPDGRTLVISHQVLERSARTSFEDVHFGALMRNALLVVPAEGLLRSGSDRAWLAESRVADLDNFGNGAGDPAGVAVDAQGSAVALAGVGELGLSAAPTGQLRRVRVGSRPTAVALSPDGRFAFAADTAGDAVWVVDRPSGLNRRAISLGPRPEPDAAERGERLFHDARLSHDHWLSCHSCHTDGQTGGLLADTLGDGSYGTPKLIPTLRGVADSGPWAWNGGVGRLEEQVRKSVETTMQGDPPTDDQVRDLTAFLRSLGPPPVRGPGSAAEARGREVFRARKCDGCHAPPAYTAAGSFDVGLADEAGLRRFNPPSLRGVGERSPLLHDGRAATLGDVFLRHGHPRGARYTPAEAADLAAFLRSL